MANGNPTDCRDHGPGSTAAEDRQVESAVLRLVLEEPDHLTLHELQLAMNQGQDDFASRDEVERAVSELVGAGLLHLPAGLVLATRAAIYLSGLDLA
jgi:hypothetical protein